MKLISEFNDYAVAPVIVEENEKGEKEYFIEGVFMQSDIKNRNGRIYPEQVMKKEVDRYVKEFVEKDRACLLYTSPSPRDRISSRMPSSA